jgi:protein-arginine kinase activator protein McsA
MKIEKYEVGGTLNMLCSSCDSEQVHTVQTVTKQGKISKAVCASCATTSSFTRGIKTAVEMGKSKTASPYDRTRKYKKGQAMLHSVFGQGEVLAV